MHYENCETCGKQIDPATKFCPFCGKEITRREIRPVKREKESNSGLKIIVGILLIALLIASVAFPAAYEKKINQIREKMIYDEQYVIRTLKEYYQPYYFTLFPALEAEEEQGKEIKRYGVYEYYDEENNERGEWMFDVEVDLKDGMVTEIEDNEPGLMTTYSLEEAEEKIEEK